MLICKFRKPVITIKRKYEKTILSIVSILLELMIVIKVY